MELAWHLERLGVTCDDTSYLVDIARVQQGRCKTMLEMAEQSLFLFNEVGEYDAKAVKKHMKAASPALLAQIRDKLTSLVDWQDEPISAAVKAVAAENEVGMGKVAQPIRIAVTGTAVSPSIDGTLRLLGREKTLARLGAAVAEFGD